MPSRLATIKVSVPSQITINNHYDVYIPDYVVSDAVLSATRHGVSLASSTGCMQ